MVRVVLAHTPLDQTVVLEDVPEEITAGALSQAVLAADLDGDPFEIRIRQEDRILKPMDPVIGGEVFLIFDGDPYRGPRVFSALVFWFVHLFPASLWFFGCSARRCIPVYFVGVFILYLIAVTSPVIATSFRIVFSSSTLVMLAQLFVVSMSPFFLLDTMDDEEEDGPLQGM
jgi:hypothetical protein